MSARQAQAFDAIAFQLVAALERYESSAAAMVAGWMDMELYRTCGREIEEIRRYSAALPQLSVAWVELLIAHAELVQTLWRNGQPGSDPKRLNDVLVHHKTCIQLLRGRALRHLHSNNTPPALGFKRGSPPVLPDPA